MKFHSTGFSTFDCNQLAKIRQHGWKERLTISEDVKFERDLLKTNEEIAPQSLRILQMFCCLSPLNCICFSLLGAIYEGTSNIQLSTIAKNMKEFEPWRKLCGQKVWNVEFQNLLTEEEKHSVVEQYGIWNVVENLKD